MYNVCRSIANTLILVKKVVKDESIHNWQHRCENSNLSNGWEREMQLANGFYVAHTYERLNSAYSPSWGSRIPLLAVKECV